MDRGNIFLLSGFVACQKQWEHFSAKWKEICEREPKTPDFKMQTAIRLTKRDGTPIWTAKQRDNRIKDLVRLTKKTAVFRVETVMAWPNYDRVVKHQVPPNSTVHIFSVSTSRYCPSPTLCTKLRSMEQWRGYLMTRVVPERRR